jgi:alpha-amylase
MEKWEKEGRLEQELAELDRFFEETGYPRAPRYYIMKWIIDLIRDYGIDGLRIDTARHVEEEVWAELKKQCDRMFREWKTAHPESVLDTNGFYMVGEVYGYQASANGIFDFGDVEVDYSKYGFNSLINFEFKGDAENSYEELFSKYSSLLHSDDHHIGALHYISSHDDSWPFDKQREQPRVAGTKLMLCPGSVQVYYGDELARPLEVEGAIGDANLRSLMNWDALDELDVQKLLEHWRKLGQFRRAHPAVGAGRHQMISQAPYYFIRTYTSDAFNDRVLIGLDLNAGQKKINVSGIFENGTRLKDYYSNQDLEVRNETIDFESEYDMVLIGL